MEEPSPYLSWSFPSKHRPQVSITSNKDDPGSSSSPAGAFGWLYAPYSIVSLHHTGIEQAQTFAWPVHSLRLYSSWLMEWTYLKTMILTMSGFLNLWWPLLQRQDTQAHSSLTYSLPWNSSLHGFRVPGGKERPSTGGSSVNIFRIRLGIQSRNSWYDTFIDPRASSHLQSREKVQLNLLSHQISSRNYRMKPHLIALKRRQRLEMYVQLLSLVSSFSIIKIQIM